MPPTVHKILLHGPSVAKKAILPIGRYSEEVLESSHKLSKLFRKSFSMKSSRIRTNEDIFKRLLLCSDPYITLTDRLPKKSSKKKFPSEVLSMLTDLPADYSHSENTLIDSESSDSE